MKEPRAGFVGLGDMGGAMAQRIIDAGFPTTLWARRDASLSPYDAGRFTRAADLPALGRSSDVVGICVFGDDDVRHVTLGPSGVLAGMAPGSVLLIHSTITVAALMEVAEEARRRGVDILDAPISGARSGALAGTLAVIVGGERAALEKALPVMESYGGLIRLMGPLGSGMRMKALHNVTSFCNGRIASIAVEVGQQFGFDAGDVLDVLRAGGARSFSLTMMMDHLIPNPQFRDHATGLMAKDLAVFQAFREEAGLPRTHIDTLAEERAGQLVPHIFSKSRSAVHS